MLLCTIVDHRHCVVVVRGEVAVAGGGRSARENTRFSRHIFATAGMVPPGAFEVRGVRVGFAAATDMHRFASAPMAVVIVTACNHQHHRRESSLLIVKRFIYHSSFIFFSRRKYEVLPRHPCSCRHDSDNCFHYRLSKSSGVVVQEYCLWSFGDLRGNPCQRNVSVDLMTAPCPT